jgi:branched-chain amino acid aminotransferase
VSVVWTVWIGDRLVPADEARVSVFDHGFTVADGVFETLKVIDGRPFALTRHLRRLAASARALDLAEPDGDLIRRAVGATAEANARALGPLGRMRITYTGSAGPLGSDRGAAETTLVVAVTQMQPWPNAARVVTVPWPRNDRGALAGVKSTSYAENVVALATARRQGAEEAIFADTRGRLCEGTGSNVLVVLGDRIVTPSLDTGALAGITRGLAIEWCGVAVEDHPIDVLSDCDGILLTSSTRDIQPVVELDSVPVPHGSAIARECIAEFHRRAGETVDP